MATLKPTRTLELQTNFDKSGRNVTETLQEGQILISWDINLLSCAKKGIKARNWIMSNINNSSNPFLKILSNASAWI